MSRVLYGANGSTVTVHGARRVVERPLSGGAGTGARTPARPRGARCVETLPGRGRIAID